MQNLSLRLAREGIPAQAQQGIYGIQKRASRRLSKTSCAYRSKSCILFRRSSFLVVLPRDAHGFRLFGSGFQTTYSKQTRFEPARSAQNRFDATRLEHARFERAPRASAYRVRAD